jgi:hypothetical protein
MSTSKDPLFILINSLNKSERRFFKIHCSKQDGAKDYLDLFDIIDSQKEYDEEKLKKCYKDKEYFKHFAVVKNYLFNAIIDSLHAQSYYDTPEFKLDELTKKIQILYQKGLIDLCLKYIEKAKRIGYENECFSELIKLLSIQHQISLRSSSLLFKKRKEIQNELDLMIEKSYNLSQYHRLARKSAFYLYTENLLTDSEEINEILQHPLMLAREMALSKKALTIFLKVHADIFEYKGQKKEAFQYNYEILKNIEADTAFYKENSFVYARAINTYLQDALALKQFEYFDYYLSILKNLLSQKISSHHLNTIKGFYFINFICKQIAFGNFKEAIAIIHENREELLSTKLIPIKYRIGISYFECVAYIGLGEYKAALIILHTILSGGENIVLALKRVSRLLSIIVQYELNNVNSLMHEIESANKYIQNFENNMAEKQIIRHINKLLKNNSDKDKIEIFKNLRDQLLAIENNEKEAQTISYFDFLSWTESKINNKPLSEIVKEKASKFN